MSEQLADNLKPHLHTAIMQHVEPISSRVRVARAKSVRVHRSDQVVQMTYEKLGVWIPRHIDEQLPSVRGTTRRAPWLNVCVSLTQLLARSIAPMMTGKLTRAVTHAVVPAVLVAVRETMPGMWQFPHCKDTICAYYNVSGHPAAPLARQSDALTR